MMATDLAQSPGSDWLTAGNGGSGWMMVDEQEARHWPFVQDQTIEVGLAEFPLFPRQQGDY